MRTAALVDLARRARAAQRRHPFVTDSVVAAAFAIASFVSISTTFEVARQDPAFEEPGWGWLTVAVLAVTAPLAFRRRYPVAVALVVTVAFVASRILLSPEPPYLTVWEPYFSVWACWLALYSAVRHRRPTRLSTLGVALVTAIFAAEVVRETYFDKDVLAGLPLNQTFLLAYNAAFLAWPLLLGAAIRSLHARQDELRVQTAELQREREENARRAVLEERVRIARELHDVVAHHVSVMGVQAGAARRVMGSRPDQAAEALASIEASSRQAVHELQRLLGFLRRADQPDELAPQPDLAQLPALIAQAGYDGLAVELEVDGEPRPLPTTLEVSAYRVIQEALTNALKHSHGTLARVRVGYTPTALEIEVLDDGDPVAISSREPVGGHGLIGMRERVRLHGGHLRAGPEPRGGFAVRATFPVTAEAR